LIATGLWTHYHQSRLTTSRYDTRLVEVYKTENMAAIDPSLYLNRELSWIEFNRRVFEEAKDSRHPLL